VYGILIDISKFSLFIIQGFRIEYRTYNALIAAFGKHNQLKMAFQLADEMVELGFTPNEDTYASLLIACNAEKNAGFKYAIEVILNIYAYLSVAKKNKSFDFD